MFTKVDVVPHIGYFFNLLCQELALDFSEYRDNPIQRYKDVTLYLDAVYGSISSGTYEQDLDDGSDIGMAYTYLFYLSEEDGLRCYAADKFLDYREFFMYTHMAPAALADGVYYYKG